VIFGADKVTTGASNDIERATKMARNMATKWGLSDELGPITYGEDEDEVFLGRSVTQHKSISNETASKIDEVVRGILDRAYARSKELLTANLDKLHTMAEAAAAVRDHRRASDRRHHGRARARAAGDWTKNASTGATPPPPPPKGDAGSAVGKVEPATQNRFRLDG
jgi:ATP-dependent Zn proteases